MKLYKWRRMSILFNLVLGSFIHFTYEWTGNNFVVGIFGAINESIWEHTKLLFWPALIFSLVEFFYIGKYYNNYIIGRAASFYIGVLMIISMFYTYSGIIGENFLVVDISIFIISVIISQYIAYKIMASRYRTGSLLNLISLVATALLIFAYVLFTINPPQIPLFREAVGRLYEFT